MCEKSKPIPIPPPNNERSWFGWGNSFYTPNKNNLENIVSMGDNESVSSDNQSESHNSDSDNNSDYESDCESNTEELFNEDQSNVFSQHYLFNKAYKFVKSKNKCEQFRDFMVNAPDVLVMWGMLTAACVFKAPYAYFISLTWYATEKDKHQKEQLEQLNDKEKLNKQD